MTFLLITTAVIAGTLAGRAIAAFVSHVRYTTRTAHVKLTINGKLTPGERENLKRAIDRVA
jgi:hypothetical protein